MKLDEPDRIRLRHMIEAAEAALGFIAGRSLEEFRSDKMIQFAVARAIEILGEAASKMTAAGRASQPALPWQAMVGMRNRLIHAYFDVDAEVVWKTVSEELPPLLVALHGIDEALEDGNDVGA
jgi:Uncharacterized conserved protein